MKRLLLTVFFLLSAVCAVWTLPFEGVVLSPVAGNWENSQPLVIQGAEDCEVYYSLTGSDPLVSGFAYDGPIMLEGTGAQHISIVSVSDRGISDIVTINYISNGRPTPSYIPQAVRDVYVRVTDKTHIEVPESVRWAAGVSADQNEPEKSTFHYGGEISLNGRCDDPRIMPLIISTSQGYYRYLLRTGFEQTSLPAPVPQYEGIEFAQWNYVRFNSGRTSLYSIDGEPWQQTAKPVFIDRTVEHTLSWKELKAVTPDELEAGFEFSASVDEIDASDAVQTMILPPKPVFSLPEKSWTNGSVELSFDSEDYILEYADRDGHIHYQNSWGEATVPGDSEGVSGHFNVYYKGIKQGSVDVSVLINRRVPEGPVLITSAENGFSRSEVKLTFHSADAVYYKVTVPEKRPYGFDFATDDIHAQNAALSVTESSTYARLEKGEIILEVNPDAAVLYKITAYSEDVSGNRSDLTQYAVIVDGANLYVAEDPALTEAQFVKDAPYGSMNNPCLTVSEALQIADNDDCINPRIFISGTHVLDAPFVLDDNIRLLGNQDARIIFHENGGFDVTGGSVSLSGITLEKRESADCTMGEKSLISIRNASLSLYDCELYADFATNGIALTADNGVINIKKCGITSRSTTYTALVSAKDTELFMYNVRGVANAPTAVGISAEGGLCYLADSAFTVIGSLGRIAEYVRLQWVLEACRLQGNNTLPVESAVWVDSSSVLLSEKANTYSGFSSLWIKAGN